MRAPRWRSEPPQIESATWAEAQEALQWLTPDLQTTLGSLHEAPPVVADAVVQLLMFGSRAALAELGVAYFPDLDTDGRGLEDQPDLSQPVTVTALGYAVMALAADALDGNLEPAASWVLIDHDDPVGSGSLPHPIPDQPGQPVEWETRSNRWSLVTSS